MFQTLNKKSFILRSILAIVFVFILALAVSLFLDEREAPRIAAPMRVEQIPRLPESITQADEIALQKQLQSIIVSQKESNCASLKDSRYQLACHEFFKVKK